MKKLVLFLFLALSLNGFAQRKYSTFNDPRIKNRGISGDISEGIYDRLDAIIHGHPQKIFLMIGINDIALNIPIDTITGNIEKTICKIKADSPETKIYLQSTLPTNPDFGMFVNHMKPDSIKELNKNLEILTEKYKVVFIDLYSHFVIKDTDKLSPEYTNDGLHLLGAGYIRWRDLVMPYVNEYGGLTMAPIYSDNMVLPRNKFLKIQGIANAHEPISVEIALQKHTTVSSSDGKWEECSETSAAGFSAVAYYFGKMLSDSLQVPIGLIHNAVGGSPLEAWIDRKTLECEFSEILEDWTRNDLIQDWVRERALLNIKESENSRQRHPYEPCYLFDSGIIPLAQYPINGVIWYQGESNAHNVEAFEKLFPLFVNSWRRNWENAELPIGYVQLSSLNRPSWPCFRDSQRKMMDKVADTYMAVSSDRGDSLDVHPPYKKDVGERLALWALNKKYGKDSLIPSGPLYRSVEFVDDKAFISFDYAEGLHAHGRSEIIGFEIAETEGLYYSAHAEVIGEKVRVWNPEVKHPQYVRYGWQPFTRADLVNNANLPASTFKTNQNKSDMKKTKSLPDYPILGGVSAPIAGIHHNKLIVAGGCNFPSRPASEGGQKVFYDEIFYLDINGKNSQWISAGNLPYKVAYGSSVATTDGIICIGGQNEKGELKNTIRIQWNSKKIIIEELPALPVSLFNAGATIIDHTIYITGGSSTEFIYALDLDTIQKGWTSIQTNRQEERQQPVVFAQNGNLFMTGGYDEKNAKVFTDILKFNFSNNQWEDFADTRFNGEPKAFVGTGSANCNGTTLFAGGVDYEIFSTALLRIKKRQEAEAAKDGELAKELQKAGKKYMSQPVEWYKFNPLLLSFDAENKEWKSLGIYPQAARAGAGVAIYNNALYIVCGELKPGVRTTEVNKIYLK